MTNETIKPVHHVFDVELEAKAVPIFLFVPAVIPVVLWWPVFYPPVELTAQLPRSILERLPGIDPLESCLCI